MQFLVWILTLNRSITYRGLYKSHKYRISSNRIDSRISSWINSRISSSSLLSAVNSDQSRSAVCFNAPVGFFYKALKDIARTNFGK